MALPSNADPGLVWVGSILWPPIMTVLWWLLSRGTGAALQGGEMSPRTKRWVDGNFWKFMIFLYVVSFGMLAYAYLR